jgi:transforming growth factor-beta-induced protein
MHRPIPIGALVIAVALVGAAAQTAAAADIVQAAKADGHFTKLAAANNAAGTTALLEGPGPFTVFAPNDDAFAKVPWAKLDALMSSAMKTNLKVTLANHVVTGVVEIAALQKALSDSDAVVVMAANNMPLIFKKDGDGITVNGAHVIKGPMKVDNGLVYVVDTVLLPAKPLQPHY